MQGVLVGEVLPIAAEEETEDQIESECRMRMKIPRLCGTGLTGAGCMVSWRALISLGRHK